MALAAQALEAQKADKPLEQGGALEQVAARIERVMGLTKKLSRPPKAGRLERWVRHCDAQEFWLWLLKILREKFLVRYAKIAVPSMPLLFLAQLCEQPPKVHNHTQRHQRYLQSYSHGYAFREENPNHSFLFPFLT